MIYYAFAYLMGCLSFGLLSEKIFQTQKIREIGSKNIGATNVLRTGNKKAALFTLLGDALKGLIPVLFAPHDVDPYFVASFCIVGHVFPFWLRFKGGKGVATALGVFSVLSPVLFFLTLLTWGGVYKKTKTSGVAAVVSFIFTGLCALWWYGNVFYLLVAALIVFTHYENITTFFCAYKK